MCQPHGKGMFLFMCLLAAGGLCCCLNIFLEAWAEPSWCLALKRVSLKIARTVLINVEQYLLSSWLQGSSSLKGAWQCQKALDQSQRMLYMLQLNPEDELMPWIWLQGICLLWRACVCQGGGKLAPFLSSSNHLPTCRGQGARRWRTNRSVLDRDAWQAK